MELLRPDADNRSDYGCSKRMGSEPDILDLELVLVVLDFY